MPESMKIEELGGGVYIYRVFDPRWKRDVTAGYYDENTRVFHKFCDSERHVQHKVSGQWLEGFGIQENVLQHLAERDCEDIRVHFAPRNQMHTSRLAVWGAVGLVARYSGVQRFLGFMTLPATKKIQEAGKNGRPPLAVAEINELNRDGRQMVAERDILPDWFAKAMEKESQRRGGDSHG